jgi:hypothetical protein
LGGAKVEENVSAKGKKKEAVARFPQQGSYGSRQACYKEKTGQGQKEINRIRGYGEKRATAARKLAIPPGIWEGKIYRRTSACALPTAK